MPRPIPTPDQPAQTQALRLLIKERNLMSALSVFHRHLGDIFQIKALGFNTIFMAGPEASRFVLVSGRGDLRWRSEHDPVTRLLHHGILVEDGETHDTIRRDMNPALHRQALAGYIDTMIRQTDAVSARWQADQPVDMLIEMRRNSLLILTETLFGIDFEPEIERLWKAIIRLTQYISPGVWIVAPKLPRPGYGNAIRKMDEYLYRIITLRRANLGSTNDLITLLITSGLTDDLIRDQLMTMLIAGHDTSTALLSWALYCIASQPDVLQRLQSELDTVVGSQAPTLEHTKDLPYLEQVINETLRLYPPIHLGSRIAAVDLDYQDYCIPAGTRVMYSIYLTHHDSKYWPDPQRFDPERFTPEAVRERPHLSFLPFGGGPRNCIGMAFAQVEAKIVLARIVQRFNLRFIGKRVHEHMGATLEPHPGVLVSATPR